MVGAANLQRVYLIGAGVISGCHLRGLESMPAGSACECHACDVRPAALEKLKAEFPSVQLHADGAEMLAAGPQATDIVVVCTPPFLHAAHVKLALASGRHVLCEKPLFLDAAEAADLERQAAGGNGLLLACCSNRFVGRRAVAKARQLLLDGSIGTPYRVRWVDRKNRNRTGLEYLPGSRWFLDRKQNGGGVTMDWSPYDFAVLDAILRPERVTVASCLMSQVETGAPLEPGTVFDVETQVIAQLQYELADIGKVQVDYERASATHGREETAFEVEGTRGAFSLDWIWEDKLRLSLDRAGALFVEEVAIEPETASVHDRPIQDMIRAVRGEPSLTIANADALFNFRCLRALYAAYEAKCPVTVERRAVAASGGPS
jgi:predicted dehydrogenase